MATYKLRLTDKAPTAREILYAEYGTSRNFFVPKILKRGKAGKWRAWELSRGRGIAGRRIWFVSVVDVNPKTGETLRRTDLANSFQSEWAAKSHIRLLRIAG